MTIGIQQATDEMFALLNSAWIAGAAAIVGYLPEIKWQGVPERNIPDASQYWARVTKQTVLEGQGSLSDCAGELGQKRYTVTGLLFIQLFLPKCENDCSEIGRQLAVLVRDAYRGQSTPGGVWFRNATINDGIPPEEICERINVVVEFEYDDLG